MWHVEWTKTMRHTEVIQSNDVNGPSTRVNVDQQMISDEAKQDPTIQMVSSVSVRFHGCMPTKIFEILNVVIAVWAVTSQIVFVVALVRTDGGLNRRYRSINGAGKANMNLASATTTSLLFSRWNSRRTVSLDTRNCRQRERSYCR